MTTTQTPVDALMALVKYYGAALRASSPADTRDPRCSGCDIANGHPDFCRCQHSRIEADEALMRTNLEALERAGASAGFQYMTHETREVIESAITALRKRLESTGS